MLLGFLFYHASYIHVGAYPLFVEIASFSLVCMVSLDFDDGCIGYNPIAMTHQWSYHQIDGFAYYWSH